MIIPSREDYPEFFRLPRSPEKTFREIDEYFRQATDEQLSEWEQEQRGEA